MIRFKFKKFEKLGELQNVQIVKYILLLNEIDVNAKYKERDSSKSALIIAVEKNNIEIVKLLFEHPNIDVNTIYLNATDEKTPLHIAVEKKQYRNC